MKLTQVTYLELDNWKKLDGITCLSIGEGSTHAIALSTTGKIFNFVAERKLTKIQPIAFHSTFACHFR